MKQNNTNILRTLAIAFMAMVCMTGKAQDFTAGDPVTDPLAAWYNGNDAYILRTIDDDHTVIDAMKALQEVNSHETLTWNDYSNYYFYLVEDVDFTGWQDNNGSWIPLGTSSNPFSSSFYCYAPSWDYFSGPTSSLGAYPKNTLESPAEDKEWEGAKKYEYSLSDIYYDSSSYNDINAWIKDQSDLSSYFVDVDTDNGMLYIYGTEDDYNNTFGSLFVNDEGTQLTPTTSEDPVYYRILPVVGTSPGYFYENYNQEEGTYDQKYYTTDGHLGTVKISNMTVNGDYDYAGFFGYVNVSVNFSGFTFENCSVATETENGYAGMLMGHDESGVYITDLFIGTSSKSCTVTAASENHAGAVLGSSGSTTSIGATDVSSYEFDEDISDSYCTQECDGSTCDGLTYSCNKIYCTVTNGTENYYSAYYYDYETSESYGNEPSVYHTWYSGAIEKTYAFGSKGNDDDGNPVYGTGTSEEDPFIISSTEHLQNLINIVNNAKYSSYLDFAGAESPASTTYYYKQTEDISFTDALTEGIGTSDLPFYGTYDGNGHTITVDITLEEGSTDYAALFANTNVATIMNLSIEGTNTGTNAAGIIGSCSEGDATLTNCIVNVTLSADNKCGLVYTGSATITNCFNKATPELGFTSASSSTDVCYYTNKAKGITDGTADENTSTTGEGTYVSPLKISSLDDLKILPEYGLYYQLTDNIFETEAKLVGPAGDAHLPAGASNNAAYIEKFCGHVDGWNGDNEDKKYYIIVGITDKALFGTITGNTTIENIGFVNCYNATNKKVNLANNVADGKTLNVDLCYGDGYFDFSAATTKTDSYSYKCNANAPVKNFTEITDDNNWTRESLYVEFSENGREILSNHSISVTIDREDYVTDAISTTPRNNSILSASTDARLRYKYNVNYNDVIEYLYLVDITARMDELSKDGLNERAAVIKATEFNGVGEGVTVKNVYYRRVKHNDWESVCLPFAFKMSDVENSSKFTAYTYSEKDDEGASFTELAADATIEAGQPVLIYNSDKTQYDFIVNVSNASGVELVTTPVDGTVFKGALQHISGVSGKYKINGEMTADGGGTLLQCTSDSWIYPFRTYLDFVTAGAKSIRFSIYNYSDDDATAIEQIISGGNTYTLGTVYGLDGLKVSDKGTEGLKSGLYIVNGKKVMVK